MTERKSTAVVSFSVDLETLNYLDTYQMINKINRSTAIRYHIRMGRAYIQQLENVDGAENGDPQ